jgi:SHS2 domain-containing protein
MSPSPAWVRPVEHTADVAIEAGAPDLAGLFDRCAVGMTELIAEGEPPEPRVEHPLAASGADLAELLADFLRQLLWLHASTGFLYAGARFLQLGPTMLDAVVAGEPADPTRHALVREIKAVTYHQLAVTPDPDGWRARVIFDV